MYKFYTTNCPKCMLIKKLLDGKKVDYETVNLNDDKTEMERIIKLGYTSAPLLDVDGNILEFKDAFKKIQMM